MSDDREPTIRHQPPHPTGEDPAPLKTDSRASDEPPVSPKPEPLPSGGRIGRYTLIRKLGQGGMGVVYLAEQAEPIRRQVAVKLIRAALDDEQILSRFNVERQTLAMMTHPGIARVFDAGTTKNGQPYFVMEYVPGLPIDRYCDQYKLPLRPRLALFLEVCEAVQHAHEKAVIHRDIKPSNILVAGEGGETHPKVIDFGVARALLHHPGESLTDQGVILGSPAYISPEQLQLGSSCADVRSDTFSLGVVLYQILTGLSPFSTGSDEKMPTLLNVLTLEPAAPSRVYGGAVDAGSRAALLSASPEELVRRLRGDLDWITLKAIAKEPGKRYASARELAADIRRHFEHRPVTASPPGRFYRLSKFARRHRTAVTGAALVVLALVAGVAGLAAGLHRARQAEADARQEAEKAQTINEFLERMLGAADPWKLGRDVKVREVLDGAARDIGGRLSGQPEVEASVRLTLGRTYTALGLLPEGHEQLHAALSLYEKNAGEGHPKTVETMAELVFCLTKLGRDREAAELGERALGIARSRLGPDHTLTLQTMGWLAVAYHRQGDFRRAESLYRQRVAAGERLGGPERVEALRSMHNLVWLLINAERTQEAEPLARRVLALSTELHGPNYPLTLLARRHQVILLSKKKDPAADGEFRALIADHARLLGPSHPDTLSITQLFGKHLYERGNYPEAERVFRELLKERRRTFGDESVYVFNTVGMLSEVRWKSGKAAEAAALLAPIIEPLTRILGPEHQVTEGIRILMLRIIVDLGRAAEAESAISRIIQAQRRRFGDDDPRLIPATCALGEILIHLGRADEAETAWKRALALEEREGNRQPAVMGLLTQLAEEHPQLKCAGVVLDRLRSPSPTAAK